ncbi:MAG: hypothetical protein MUD17_11255 [Gemmatimonadaceae bacterium]|nr:hypothetical protein [Gemmatimonadaceae bacterium]
MARTAAPATAPDPAAASDPASGPFDVDSTGRVIDFELTSTRDSGYDRKLREILAATRFRPATDASGRPVRSKYNLDYTF